MTDAIQHPKFEPDSSELIRRYFLTVKRILLTPSAFFRDLPTEGGLAKPLTFALVTHWIGAAFTYIWALIAGNALEKMATRYVQFSAQGPDVDSVARATRWFAVQQQAAHWFWHWFWGAGSIILDPFKTIVMIFVTALFIFVAARLFVNSSRQKDVTYESAVRLVSYGITPAILSAFPFVGTFASGIYIMVVTIIGAREYYRVGSGRAGLIVLFPYLLFFGIIAMGVLLMAFLALKLAISVV